jgi:hypothetical protein
MTFYNNSLKKYISKYEAKGLVLQQDCHQHVDERMRLDEREREKGIEHREIE